MAWLEQRSGLNRVAFRRGGRKLHYSVGSSNRKEVQACMARLRKNLRLGERGRLEVPLGADMAVILVPDGKLNATPLSRNLGRSPKFSSNTTPSWPHRPGRS
ncbi:MAG TPA: hypothetical protein VE988_16080 [Gemmataceae bacterium]|nr:hypothetical protein [Gemmataceae bacterium]